MVQASVQALAAAAGTGAIVSAVRISRSSQPLVVLSTLHAFVFHSGLQAWLRVADDAFPSSTYHQTIFPPNMDAQGAPFLGGHSPRCMQTA